MVGFMLAKWIETFLLVVMLFLIAYAIAGEAVDMVFNDQIWKRDYVD